MSGCSVSSWFSHQLSGMFLSTHKLLTSYWAVAQQSSADLHDLHLQWTTASIKLPFPDFSADRRVIPRSAVAIGKF